MKKLLASILGVVLCLSLAACGGEASNLTIDDVTAAIQTVDPNFTFDEEKPLFQMIGAQDGWIGYVNDSPVKVYQYDNDSYKEACDAWGELITSCPKKGDFVLDCSQEEVIAAFNNLEE